MTRRFGAGKSWFAAAAAVTAVSLVAAACGSSGTKATGSSGSTGGEGSTNTTSSGGGGKTPAAGKGGNLVIARMADSESMNETTVFDNESIWVFENLYQGLYTVTPNGKGVQPELATGYTVSKNKKTYTFALRKGVKFSNGTPLTSADVKFSIDKNRAATQGWGYIDTAIKSVDDPKPDTVVINLSHPWAPLLADLSLFANDIIPNNYGGKTETQFYNHPIGTGPFKWDYWHKGQALKLVRNTYYWQPGKPYLNSVTWTDVANDNTRMLQLENGQAQVDEFPAWATVSQLKSQPKVHVDLFNSTRTDYLALNEKLSYFKNLDVRQAVSYAINRASMVHAVLFGNGKPANSLFPPQVPYYDPNTKGLQYDLAKAKAALAKSPWPHGFTTTLLIPSNEADDTTLAAIIQSNLAAIGIKIKVESLDANVANTDFQTLKYDMTLSYWTMDIPDPDELATFAVDPKAGSKSFFTDYDDPAVVSDAHQAEQTLSTTARAKLYNDLQNRVASDAFMAFLYYSPYAYASGSDVNGFYVTPLGNYHLENVWISGQ